MRCEAIEKYLPLYVPEELDQLYEEVRRQARKGISAQQRQLAQNLQKIRPYYHRWYQGWERLDFKPFYVMNSRT